MKPIYAASFSVSQGAGTPSVRATLLSSLDGDESMVTMEWTFPTPINPDGNAGEWLYAALSRLVQDFDDHMVTKVEFKPFPTDAEVRNV